MESNNSFLGKGWKFPPSFDPTTRRTHMVEDSNSIHTSLGILMGTAMGERLMQPTYGTDIRSYLFQNIDLSMATMIQSLILDAIREHEPRIIANHVNVDVMRMHEGILSVTIDYTIRKTNSRANIVFPFYLTEGNLIPERLT